VDDKLRSQVYGLKERYMTHAQALIHNDLHTGSILLNQDETKVINPEFAFFGPIGHDVGTYLGNMVLSYAAQEFHAFEETERRQYRAWIIDSIRETWQVFNDEFQSLWETDGNGEWPSPTYRKDCMLRLLKDAAGFGGAEMFRHLIGMAHVHDFWTFEDEVLRARAESIAMNTATRWIMELERIGSIDDLIEIVLAAKPHPAL
jgi:5-methylthioribose kinase